MKPVITIVMSVYNGEMYVGETIRSVLSQSYSDFEFIIIDDGSTDNTLKILEDFQNKDIRIKIIENDKNSGLTLSLNKGIKESKGGYIARIDCGDIWEYKKLELQLSYIKNNPEIIALGTQAVYIDDNGNKIGKSNLPSSDQGIRLAFLKSENPFIHSSVIFRSGYYYNENYSQCQDIELWTRLYYEGSLANLGDSLVKYRFLANSISFKNRSEQICYFYIIYCTFVRLLGGKNDDENKNVQKAHNILNSNHFSYFNYLGNRLLERNKYLGLFIVFFSYAIYPKLLFIKIKHKTKIFFTLVKYKDKI
jgi:glycosyltransferase involved in cell wall biosynthesis